MAESYNLAFVASDPGGANALMPVMERLKKQAGVRLLAWPYRQTTEIWRERGFGVDPLDEKMDVDQAIALLRRRRVNLLVTGTSLNEAGLEKKLVLAARAEGIPSLGILDFYSNYLERFNCDQGPFACMPDRVAVMDEFSREQMLLLGAAPERVVVTGQPAFDRLENLRRASRPDTRVSLGVSDAEKLVTFISQPMIEMYGQDPAGPDYPGYDQHIVLLDLLHTLENLADEGEKIVLVVRIHPREDAAWFGSLASRTVRLICMSDNTALQAAHASDLVVGMTSTLLLESIYLGSITLSLQPEARLPETIPAIIRGDIPVVYRRDQIASTVKSLLYDHQRRQELQTRLEELVPDNEAARRVVDLINDMLNWRRQR